MECDSCVIMEWNLYKRPLVGMGNVNTIKEIYRLMKEVSFKNLNTI